MNTIRLVTLVVALIMSPLALADKGQRTGGIEKPCEFTIKTVWCVNGLLRCELPAAKSNAKTKRPASDINPTTCQPILERLKRQERGRVAVLVSSFLLLEVENK